MGEYLFFMVYPISGYAYMGSLIKRVKAPSPEEAAGRMARFIKEKFKGYKSLQDWSVEDIQDELLTEPGVFQSGDIEVTFPFDEELE